MSLELIRPWALALLVVCLPILVAIFVHGLSSFPKKQRIVSTVLLQSIGLDNNRDVFYGLFDSWRDEIQDRHPDVADDAWTSFRANMFDGDFDFNVGRDFVRGC